MEGFQKFIALSIAILNGFHYTTCELDDEPYNSRTINDCTVKVNYCYNQAVRSSGASGTEQPNTYPRDVFCKYLYELKKCRDEQGDLCIEDPSFSRLLKTANEYDDQHVKCSSNTATISSLFLVIMLFPIYYNFQ